VHPLAKTCFDVPTLIMTLPMTLFITLPMRLCIGRVRVPLGGPRSALAAFTQVAAPAITVSNHHVTVSTRASAVGSLSTPRGTAEAGDPL